MRRREFIQNKSEDQPVELIEATGGDPSTGCWSWMLVVARATIDERTMLVERGNGPIFYVTIDPTVNSTAKDYKRSFNRSTGIILCFSTVQQELSCVYRD